MLKKMNKIARPSSPVAIIGDAQWTNEYELHPNQKSEMIRAKLQRKQGGSR